jgi:hypothetical protein
VLSTRRDTKRTMRLQYAFLLKRKSFVWYSEQRKEKSKVKVILSLKLLTKPRSLRILQLNLNTVDPHLSTLNWTNLCSDM